MTRLVLIRGLPGSGKSTMAKQLECGGFIHLETDRYWGPEYKFDVSKLADAHRWCQGLTELFLSGNYSVVVSNTFTTVKELKPYFELAKKYNIVPNVMMAQGNWKSVHNVPDATLTKMKNRFQYDISELYEIFDQ